MGEHKSLSNLWKISSRDPLPSLQVAETPEMKENEDLEEWIIESPLGNWRTLQMRSWLRRLSRLSENNSTVSSKTEQRNENLDTLRIER